MYPGAEKGRPGTQTVRSIVLGRSRCLRLLGFYPVQWVRSCERPRGLQMRICEKKAGQFLGMSSEDIQNALLPYRHAGEERKETENTLTTWGNGQRVTAGADVIETDSEAGRSECSADQRPGFYRLRIVEEARSSPHDSIPPLADAPRRRYAAVMSLGRCAQSPTGQQAPQPRSSGPSSEASGRGIDP